MTINLTFYQNCNFLVTHARKKLKWWFFAIFGKQPMRRELANWILKANKWNQIQIGGFTISLSKYGRVWTWIACFFKVDSEYELENCNFCATTFSIKIVIFLKLIPNINLKISISKIGENLIFSPQPQRAFACMPWGDSRADDNEDFSIFDLKKL